MQLKHYEIVTDVDKLKVDIQKVCMEHKTIKHWAYILHDKDDTRAHYHIYVNFGNAGVPHDSLRHPPALKMTSRKTPFLFFRIMFIFD